LPVGQDEQALCSDKVRYVGDAVAAVAAVDEETADRALDLIDVVYDDLPTTRIFSRATRTSRWNNTRVSPSGHQLES